MPITKTVSQQESGYLHGMPADALRRLVKLEEQAAAENKERWSFQGMVAGLYLDLDNDCIASQSAYAVQWRLGYLNGDRDKDRARMRLRRNWWAAIVRAVIYRATSNGRQMERGPATRIPAEWWSLLDVGDPLRLAYHEHQQKSKHTSQGKATTSQDKAHSSQDKSPESSAKSDSRKGSTQDPQDVEDARAHWSVEIVQRFRTQNDSRLSDREAVHVWKIMRSYPPTLARKALNAECTKTWNKLQKKGLSPANVRIDYLMQDVRRSIESDIQREHDNAASTGRRPRDDFDGSGAGGMTYEEMVAHHQEHHAGSDLRKHYRIDEHGAWHHTS